jgi:hypothetical protein
VQFDFRINTEGFVKSLEEYHDQHEAAFEVAKNMVASMMREEVTADIKSAGKFGDDYLQGLKVEVDGDIIRTTIDAPGANIFETGGTIEGKPLLWLPISGTDAEGIQASDYGDKLFSVNRKAGGPPLLFSIKDRAPKYFGIPSVTIPQKFHVNLIQQQVMQNWPHILNEALNNG